MNILTNKIKLSDGVVKEMAGILESEHPNFNDKKKMKEYNISSNIYTKTSLKNKKYPLKQFQYVGKSVVYKVVFSHNPDDIYYFDQNQTFQIVTEDKLFWLPLSTIVKNYHNLLTISIDSQTNITQISRIEKQDEKQETWRIKIKSNGSEYYYILGNDVVTKCYPGNRYYD